MQTTPVDIKKKKVWKRIGWVSKLEKVNHPFRKNSDLSIVIPGLLGQGLDDDTCQLACSGACLYIVAELPIREMMMTKKRPLGNGAAEPGRKGWGRSKRKNPWDRWQTRWRPMSRTGTDILSWRHLWVVSLSALANGVCIPFSDQCNH